MLYTIHLQTYLTSRRESTQIIVSSYQMRYLNKDQCLNRPYCPNLEKKINRERRQREKTSI